MSEQEQLKPGTRVLVLVVDGTDATLSDAILDVQYCYESVVTGNTGELGPSVVSNDCVAPSRADAIAAIAKLAGSLAILRAEVREGKYDDWLTAAAPVAADGDGREN